MAEANAGMADRTGPRTDVIDDGRLIAASLSMPEHFAVLFDRHAVAIHRYVARRLGIDAADDVMADVFLQAFQRRAAYDVAIGDARPWLYGIATNLIRRRQRDELRLYRALSRAGTEVDHEQFVDQIVAKVTARAMRGELAAALAILPPPQRDVLLLVASELSVAETASALGIPEGTAASRLARARKKVRSILRDSVTDPSV